MAVAWAFYPFPMHSQPYKNRMADANLTRIPPFSYVHVFDSNTNLTYVVEGPLTFVKKDHEQIVLGPEKMIKITPMNYIIIANPVICTEEGKVALNAFGMAAIRFGDKEIRTLETHPEQFPLYPGEASEGALKKIPVILQNEALKLRANRYYEDSEAKRHAGDEWLHRGPCSYVPRIECEILEIVKPITIKSNVALRIRAKRETVDKYGNKRKAGAEWLVRETGYYLPGVDEEVMGDVKAIVLTEKTALQLRALETHEDVYGKTRKTGEEWLVTLKDSDTHIPDVTEIVIKSLVPIILNSRQYCYVLNPMRDNVCQLGVRELRIGEKKFFLQPGEELESGKIHDVYVLSDQQALLLRAVKRIERAKEVHEPGECWMIYGPCDFIPTVEVEVVEVRKSIPLAENEGIYVRDTRTGEVKSVIGQAYMLLPHEQLWEMELEPRVEKLLQAQAPGKRDKSRVVAFRVPHNSAVQVYDYRMRQSRVVFGPDRIMLGPDEQFTVLSLSGETPKREGVIQSLYLNLGPDFMTEQVVVETLDHARLALTLSYSWEFDVNREDPVSANKLFKVKDFVGDACKTLASRIRGNVSSHSFEYFHLHSVEIITAAVFGKRKDDPRKEIRFTSNNLVVRQVDIQTVEPVDEKTKESLQKSVTMAIEITTEASKAKAEHQAKLQGQSAAGQLNLQKINDEVEAERAKQNLIALKAKSLEVQQSGKAVAEASSRAKASKIEWEGRVSQAELEVEASSIQHQADVQMQKDKDHAEEEHELALMEIEVNKSRELARIEAEKFANTMNAVGRSTVVSMARAGPEFQSKMLKGLGLKGFMVMSGKNPINLFSTASGMLGNPGA